MVEVQWERKTKAETEFEQSLDWIWELDVERDGPMSPQGRSLGDPVHGEAIEWENRV